LEEDKNAAEAYRQKEAEFYCLRINVLKWSKIRCSKNVEKLESQLAGLQEKLDYEQGKLEKKNKELLEMEVCLI
jgi:chromosome segregation ATPase